MEEVRKDETGDNEDVELPCVIKGEGDWILRGLQKFLGKYKTNTA